MSYDLASALDLFKALDADCASWAKQAHEERQTVGERTQRHQHASERHYVFRERGVVPWALRRRLMSAVLGCDDAWEYTERVHGWSPGDSHWVVAQLADTLRALYDHGKLPGTDRHSVLRALYEHNEAHGDRSGWWYGKLRNMLGRELLRFEV